MTLFHLRSYSRILGARISNLWILKLYSSSWEFYSMYLMTVINTVIKLPNTSNILENTRHLLKHQYKSWYIPWSDETFRKKIITFIQNGSFIQWRFLNVLNEYHYEYYDIDSWYFLSIEDPMDNKRCKGPVFIGLIFQWEMVREGFILFIVASYSIYYIFLK